MYKTVFGQTVQYYCEFVRYLSDLTSRTVIGSSLVSEDGRRYTHLVEPSPRRSWSVRKSTNVGTDCGTNVETSLWDSVLVGRLGEDLKIETKDDDVIMMSDTPTTVILIDTSQRSSTLLLNICYFPIN